MSASTGKLSSRLVSQSLPASGGSGGGTGASSTCACTSTSTSNSGTLDAWLKEGPNPRQEEDQDARSTCARLGDSLHPVVVVVELPVDLEAVRVEGGLADDDGTTQRHCVANVR